MCSKDLKVALLSIECAGMNHYLSKLLSSPDGAEGNSCPALMVKLGNGTIDESELEQLIRLIKGEPKKAAILSALNTQHDLLTRLLKVGSRKTGRETILETTLQQINNVLEAMQREG